MTNALSDPEKMLPLSNAHLNIMAALLDGAKHGYAIMQEIEEGGGGQLGPTTLYRNIRILLKKGLLEEIDPPEDQENIDERRRYYKLTPFGVKVISAEMKRLKKFIRTYSNKPVLGTSSIFVLGGA